MTDVFEDQVKLMKAFGLNIEAPSGETGLLYLKLVIEEFCETLAAANPPKAAAIEKLRVALEACLPEQMDLINFSNLVAVFDGLIDLMVTASGAGIALGLPMRSGWNEVLRSNMSKVDPETGQVLRREDGKVMKPPGYSKPDLLTVLRTAGNSQGLAL